MASRPFLELAEAIPTEAQRINQIGIENVNFADRKIVRDRGRYAEPRTQLRAAAWPRSAAGELIFTISLQITARKRIGIRNLVVDLEHAAVRRLLPTVVGYEGAGKSQVGVQAENIESQLVRDNSF